MARLIFISPYMKGGRDAARLAHRTRYFATREGVQLLKDDNAHLPVTKKQQQYIQRLLRSFPEARELPEHEDYANTPNRQTAFALIAQIHEDFIEPMDSRENYLDYVANRPGVKALGEHGLWDANGKVPSLENAVAEVAQHTGNVWTPIISLSRENAERLGYTDIKNWQDLINASITDIAKGYKIHPDRLRWYAAMHEKEKHIHVHMVLFSTDPKEGYLSRQGIRSIKSALVSTIYRNDRLHIYEQKDEQRGLLRQEAEARMATLIEQMATGNLQSDKLELLVTDLAQRLREVSGKKVYGYLPPRVKRVVDEIVDELAKESGCRPPMLYGRISESSFALTIIRHHRSEYRCRSKRSSRLCATWSSGKRSGFRRCTSPSRMMPCRMRRRRKNRLCLQIQVQSG